MLNRRQAIIWTNVDLIHWRIYTALVGDELTQNSQVKQYNLPLGWTYFAYITTCIPGFTFFIVLKCSLFISNVQWHLTEGNELSFSLYLLQPSLLYHPPPPSLPPVKQPLPLHWSQLPPATSHCHQMAMATLAHSGLVPQTGHQSHHLRAGSRSLIRCHSLQIYQ